MLVRMKLVLVQSLGVSLIVISVKPLPPMLNMATIRKMVALTISESASDTRPVRLPVTVDVVVALLTLVLTSTSNDSDTASCDILPLLYDAVYNSMLFQPVVVTRKPC